MGMQIKQKVQVNDNEKQSKRIQFPVSHTKNQTIIFNDSSHLTCHPTYAMNNGFINIMRVDSIKDELNSISNSFT